MFVSYDPDGKTKDPKNLSRESYQELLWHMLLRGIDTFFVWAGPGVVRDTQEVYAAAQEYGEFLDHGMPINFDVPQQQDTIISGLVLRDRVVVRRTDFNNSDKPVEILAGTKRISVPPSPGKCMIISF